MTAGISIFSVGDMVLYNRRKKREYAAAYVKLWEQRHVDALRAEAMGTATETQLALIRQERDAQDAHSRSQRRSVWERASAAFGIKDLSEDAGGTQTWQQKQQFLENNDLGMDSAVPGTGNGGVLAAVDEHRRRAETHLQAEGVRGGPLDQMADRAASKATAEITGGVRASSWFMWGSTKPES